MSQTSHAPEVGQYDEAEIVEYITNIYKVLIRLGHYADGEVQFAPPEGFEVDVSQASVKGPVDPRVLSLMRHLPQAPRNGAIGVGMKPVYYGDSDDVRRSRDIDKLEYSDPRHREGFARPTIILIAEGQDDHHPQVVLDVADSTIREVGDKLDDNDNRREVDPDGGSLSNHHLNWPKEDAKSYLEHMLHRYLSAEWVPDFLGGIIPTNDKLFPCEGVRRALLEDYRWPGADFRREAWLLEGPGLVDAALGWKG